KTNKIVGLTAIAVFVIAALGHTFVNLASASSEKGEKVKISYMQWDSEIASTNVIAEILKEEGYQVQITPLDNAVMWQTVANGDADF
ncbi:hypothetical protein L0O74_12460, partial [Bifidobacterium longum]|nr:hypothetical protein [Bifidobacterium longum]